LSAENNGSVQGKFDPKVLIETNLFLRGVAEIDPVATVGGAAISIAQEAWGQVHRQVELGSGS